MAEVLVAMSGGVDSSVTAALLKDQGHDVVGVTLKLWGGESDSGCCSVSDVDDARRVAQQLDIDHHVFNFGDDFDILMTEKVGASRSRTRPSWSVTTRRPPDGDGSRLTAALEGSDSERQRAQLSPAWGSSSSSSGGRSPW